MNEQLFNSPESFVHAALGVASFVYSPLLVVPYAVYQYSNSSVSSPDNLICAKRPSYTVQGIEYGVGYFGALLMYQYFLGLQY